MIEIPINPIEINGNECRAARVSLAVSSGVALRAVPFDSENNEYPEASITVVGDGSDAIIFAFLSNIQPAIANLVANRGL